MVYCIVDSDTTSAVVDDGIFPSGEQFLVKFRNKVQSSLDLYGSCIPGKFSVCQNHVKYPFKHM